MPFILMLPDFLDFLRGTQQATSCVDVLSTAGTDGGEDPMISKEIAKLLHLGIIDTMERNVWNRMETNEVYAAIQSL